MKLEHIILINYVFNNNHITDILGFTDKSGTRIFFVCFLLVNTFCFGSLEATLEQNLMKTVVADFEKNRNFMYFWLQILSYRKMKKKNLSKIWLNTPTYKN